LISSVLDYFYDLYDNFNQLFEDIDKLVKYGTYYIYISGGLIIIMFVLLIIQFKKINDIKKQNNKILEYMKNKEE
jgi:uncharacterized membrane protein